MNSLEEEDTLKTKTLLNHVDSDFAPLLSEVDASTLEADGAVVVGLRPDFSIGFINLGWIELSTAEDRGEDFDREWGLGANYVDAIHGPAKEFYRQNLTAVFETGQPWVHEYECPSASVLWTTRLKARPVGDSEGLLLVHSTLDRRLLKVVGADWTEDYEQTYRSAEGFIAQCSHCSRLRVAGTEDEWNWVAAAIRTPPENISHGICDGCFERFY